MKKLFTIIAILVTSAIFAQVQEKKMVLIPDYTETYEFEFEQELKQRYYNTYGEIPVLPQYTRRSNDIFVIGNFNRTNIIQTFIQLPKPNADNNISEYVKTTQFNPDRTLQEILRNDNL